VSIENGTFRVFDDEGFSEFTGKIPVHSEIPNAKNFFKLKFVISQRIQRVVDQHWAISKTGKSGKCVEQPSV
jgi:hypothetical protein